MSIWIILWLVLSAGLLYFTAWTFLILQRQKKAWRAFAGKYKMRYTPNGMLESPSVNGMIDEYTVGILVGTHSSDDERRARKLSAIEVTLHSALPAQGGIGSGAMVPVVQGLNLKSEVKIDHPDWKDDYIATTSKKALFDKYLTPERRDGLISLMNIKNSSVIFIFREDIMLLRFDTPDPLDKPQSLDKIVKKMIAVSRVLEVDDSLPENQRLEPAENPAENPAEEAHDDASDD